MPELEPQAAPQAAGSKVSQTIARLKALAQRIPWWGWLLIAVGLYLGYRLISGMLASASGDQNPSDGSSSVPGMDPGASSDGGIAGLPALPDVLHTLPNVLTSFEEDHGDGNGHGEGGDGVDLITLQQEIDRQNKQGADVQYVTKQNKLQQAANEAMLRQASPQDESTIARNIQASNAAAAQRAKQLSAASPLDETAIALGITPKTAATRPPTTPARTVTGTPLRPTSAANRLNTQLRRQTAAGVGAGPDTATYGGSHYMRRGETLSEVAERYGVDTEDLYAANRDRLSVRTKERGWMGLGPHELVDLDGLVLSIPRK